jgi:hypothetical protein
VPIGDAHEEEVDVNKARFDRLSDVEPIALSASRSLRQQQIVDLQARADRRVFGRHTLGDPPAHRPILPAGRSFAVSGPTPCVRVRRVAATS